MALHESRALEAITLTSALEFDFRTIADGSSAAVRYANNSNYRNDSLIRKESEWEDPRAGANASDLTRK
jgi:hypothetical protein